MLKTGTDPGKLGQLVTLDHTCFSLSPHSQVWLHPYFWSKAMGTQGPEVRQCRRPESSSQHLSWLLKALNRGQV